MATATALKPSAPKQLPPPNADFFQFADLLSDEERAVVKKVRAYMETKVQPVINKHWVEDTFPFELLPSYKELGIAGIGMHGYGCPGGSPLLVALTALEIARTDVSFCTFHGVHTGLAMNSIYLAGTEEQKQKWLPPMARMEKIGCFALTEPLVGSGAGAGLLTTAKREGDTWILNGQKRWIGNAPWCDISIVWARDVADNQVKGFIVENKTTPGFSVEKIQNKIALKVVQNGQITLTDCRVPDANRLQGGKGTFRDPALVLRGTRHGVGWEITGAQMGAYENALKYAQERMQFGKPIGSFQLIQELLAKMLANIVACQSMLVRSVQLETEGKLTDAQAAIVKAFCTSKARETVAWAREVLGGNGILVDYKRRQEPRAELGSLTDRPLKAKPAKVKVKYRGPNGETWSGVGAMAGWLKKLKDGGEDVERYRVPT